MSILQLCYSFQVFCVQPVKLLQAARHVSKQQVGCCVLMNVELCTSAIVSTPRCRVVPAQPTVNSRLCIVACLVEIEVFRSAACESFVAKAPA